MSKKKQVLRTVLEPNEATTITVANKAEFQDTALVGYKPVVTIKVELPFQKQPYQFNSEDELADFVGQIDIEDPQQSLF